MMRRRAALIGAAALIVRPVAALARETAGDRIDEFSGTTLRFADVDAARSVLGAEDDWVRATGEFQRRAVMGSATPVTLDAFRAWNAAAAQAWREIDRERWRKALQRLAPSFATLRIPLPREVLIVSTSGQESAGAPYTRANAVVLADGPVVQGGGSDAMLLAHELWHVASRHAPALATRLYAELGFEPVAPLEFPAAWAPIRIANPDAPENRHAITLRVDVRTVRATPVLVANRTTLAPGESFFSVAEARLLQIESNPGDAVSRAVLRDGEPVWHRLDGPHDYLRRLGGNTGYVIHPEETLAENIALLATGARARNPELLARLRAVLESTRQEK